MNFSKYRNKLSRWLGAACFAALGAAAMSSCSDAIYDDLDPCRIGVELRFVYDYNMEWANAFPAKVDCVTLYIYDADGRYLAQRSETSEALRDENYRMILDLPQGSYRMVAYGGTTCDNHSFSLVNEPDQGSLISDLRVAMDDWCINSSRESSKSLHPLFWGTLDVTVSGDDYTQATLPMMKDTNNLRILLQHVSGKPVDNRDFDFKVTDDNTLLGHDNAPLPDGGITYRPWTRGQAVAGTNTDGSNVEVAYAELSMSRLVTQNAPCLVITRHADGGEVVNIPLINYLLLLKSDLYAKMPAQEFLDRESEWSMLFFLTGGDNDGNGATWLKTHIVVNDWIVRLNDIDMTE